MKLPVFKLEAYLAQWEFKAKYLFSCSDMETISLKELISMADAESIALWENLKLGYTEDQGLPLLLSEISCLYSDPDIHFGDVSQKNGLGDLDLPKSVMTGAPKTFSGKLYTGLSSKNILTFSGAEEGIYCLFQAILDSSDHVIVVSPCYQSLESIPMAIGCEVSRVSLEEKSQWKLDIAQVEKAIKKNTKLIVINFPHNPTGVTLDLSSLNQLVTLARKNGIIIFSDEVYRLLELDPRNQMPPIAQIYEKGVSLNVMSKSYGLAGLRIGWLASQDLDLLQKARSVKHYSSICNSAPSEVLALMALRSSNQILRRNHEIIAKNISLLDSFISKNPSVMTWVRPTGGCVGFPKLHLNISVDDFASRLVNEYGVLIMPASVYDLKSNHFRIGFGKKNMPDALEVFESFLRKEFF